MDSHGGLLIGISIAREMDQSLAVAAGDVKGSLAWLLGGATSAVERERAADAGAAVRAAPSAHPPAGLTHTLLVDGDGRRRAHHALVELHDAPSSPRWSENAERWQ